MNKSVLPFHKVIIWRHGEAPPGYPFQVPREARGTFHFYPLPKSQKSRFPKNGAGIFLFLFFGSAQILFCQELYPLSEPASSVPKGVVGVRVVSQHFTEVKTPRSLNVLRVMYGFTARLSVMATGSMSNHHSRKLPTDLISHSHVGNQTNYFTNNILRGVKYPMLFNGFHLFAKYRFLSLDKKNEHFRMSLYGEWSNANQAHDEAEPNLMDDMGGYGGGLLATWLKNRFAASITYGLIFPQSYSETQPDFSGGPDLPTTIYYGDAMKYNVSLGYRLSPNRYTDCDQVNWNLYVEFVGKQYEAARVIQNGTEIGTKALALIAGNYLEVHPGIQRIVKSNLRIEASVGVSLIGRSYVHFNPVWTVAVQRYFYRRSKS